MTYVETNELNQEKTEYLEITLDLPPTVNHMYRNAYKNGRSFRVLTPKAKKWIEKVSPMIIQAMQDYEWETKSEKVIVKTWWYYPDIRDRDSNNLWKLLLDTMEKCGVFVNDKYALERTQDWVIDRENPRVEMKLTMKRDEIE